MRECAGKLCNLLTMRAVPERFCDKVHLKQRPSIMCPQFYIYIFKDADVAGEVLAIY